MDSQAKLGVDTEVMPQSPLVTPHLKLTTPAAQVSGASGEKKKTLPGIKIAGDTEKRGFKRKLKEASSSAQTHSGTEKVLVAIADDTPLSQQPPTSQEPSVLQQQLEVQQQELLEQALPEPPRVSEDRAPETMTIGRPGALETPPPPPGSQPGGSGSSMAAMDEDDVKIGCTDADGEQHCYFSAADDLDQVALAKSAEKTLRLAKSVIERSRMKTKMVMRMASNSGETESLRAELERVRQELEAAVRLGQQDCSRA